MADFAAIVVLSFFFSSSGGSAGAKVVLLAAFAAMVAVTGVVVLRAGRSMRLGDLLIRLQDTTAEIRVRLAVVLLVAFVAFATRFGLESILGAFLAGAVVGLVDRDSASHPHLRTKLEAIGFGFVVPVFFISSGVRLDLTGLMHSPGALVRVPVFFVILLVGARCAGIARVARSRRPGDDAVGLLQATSLPFLVTATQIGLVLGKITSVTAAAIVCAGLLSVLAFPPAALALLRERVGDGSPEPVRSARYGRPSRADCARRRRWCRDRPGRAPSRSRGSDRGSARSPGSRRGAASNRARVRGVQSCRRDTR